VAETQLSLEAQSIDDALANQGFVFVRHGIEAEQIDGLISTYATFTDELEDPGLEIMNNMITNPDDLDGIDRAQNIITTKGDWNKYHTNHPEFAKPGGYTNRSLQVAALRKFGRKVTDRATSEPIDPSEDPKEYYHFHPTSTVRMLRLHREMGWSNAGPPVEVFNLHESFAAIHEAGKRAVIGAYQALEETHPELVPKHFGPSDVSTSPVRLLFYHPGQAAQLAEGHYDKAMSTLQIAESHLGLQIRDPKTGQMTRVDRKPELAAFFLGKSWHNLGAYPDSPLQPGWHDVVNLDEVAERRNLHGKNVVRWAIIFFANSIAAGTIKDKSLTHTE
jgi:hypothetical protein